MRPGFFALPAFLFATQAKKRRSRVTTRLRRSLTHTQAKVKGYTPRMIDVTVFTHGYFTR